MTINEFNKILKRHALWLKTQGLKGEQANLAFADLRGLYLRDMNLKEVNLSFANLVGVDLRGSNLENADLRGADLTRASLVDANMVWVNLSEANLTDSKMINVNLSGSNLTDSYLIGANLVGANLRSADLMGSILAGAKLQGTNGNNKHIKAIFCGVYDVAYTSEVIQIGCEMHKIEDWMNFDDARILEMDGKKALKWWREWKPILQQIIVASPATPTR